MRLTFQCPWCAADTSVMGSASAAWRFRILCGRCDREVVLTWEGALAVGKAPASEPLRHSDEATGPFPLVDAA